MHPSARTAVAHIVNLDGGGRANAERERHHGQQGESRLLGEAAQPVAKVLPDAAYRPAPTKMAFGIIACTPLFPSTSCVIARSAATLDSMYASSRLRCFCSTRKS